MHKIKIIYEDNDILVVDKPANLLTISTEKETNRTLYHDAREYLKKVNPKNKLFIVHRLDKDTSGLVIFAKNLESKEYLQNNWDETERIYHAICMGKLDNKGTIKNYLKENKTLYVYETNSKFGKLAITEYEKIKSYNNLNLVKIKILTGRKNQIRVHFNGIGCPILGDRKYGKNKMSKNLLLHASVLTIKHPKTKEVMTFFSPLPKYFSLYLKIDN